MFVSGFAAWSPELCVDRSFGAVPVAGRVVTGSVVAEPPVGSRAVGGLVARAATRQHQRA